MNAELVDCRFDGAHCEDWRLWQTDVTGCTFTRTTLAASMLGCTHEGRPDTWSHCTFIRTDLRDCDLSDSDVHDCEFTDARIERFTALHTTWERCTFTGRLRTVRFSGLPHPPGADMPRLADAWWMDEVDFSACTFHDVVLDDHHLDTVSLPVGTVVFPAGPATWAAAAAHLRRQPDSPGLETALSMADYFAGRPGCAGDGQSIYSPLGIPADGPLVDALLRAGAHVVPPPS